MGKVLPRITEGLQGFIERQFEGLPLILEWATATGPKGLAVCQRENNMRSIDGLPTPLTGTAPA